MAGVLSGKVALVTGAARAEAGSVKVTARSSRGGRCDQVKWTVAALLP